MTDYRLPEQTPFVEMTTITQIRIQKDEEYWYTAEDTDINVLSTYFGSPRRRCQGFTVSMWEYDKEKGDKRVAHVCMKEEEALALAKAIHELFKAK